LAAFDLLTCIAPYGFRQPSRFDTLAIHTAAMILSGIYVLGIIALRWAPETKDKPLPED
jgi:hypothetical protein